MPNIVLRGVTLSFPQLFEARLPMNPRPGQKARYSATFLIPVDLDIKEAQGVCYNLIREKYGDKTDDLLALAADSPARIRWPFRKDNVNTKGDQRFDPAKYKAFVNAWSEQQPGVVDRYADPQTGKAAKITQASRLYAGCIVNVSLNPFLYDANGNRGLALGLQNVQFWSDGTRLDNRRAAEDEFHAEERPAADISQVGAPTEGAAPAGGTGARASKINDLFS